jgi:hypothetical protein
MLLLLLHYIEYTMIDRLDNTTASIKILSFFKFHSAPENGENNKRMLSELMRIESEKIRDPLCTQYTTPQHTAPAARFRLLSTYILA